MDHDVIISIVTNGKAGVLSQIIRDIGHYGLVFKDMKFIQNQHNRMIKVYCSGKLHCASDRLIEILERHENVIKVENIEFNNESESKPVSNKKIHNADDKIMAHVEITPAVLLLAEKRLADIMGPVATILVEEASGQCSTAGELFQHLSVELDTEQEKNSFVSIIQQK